MKLNRRAAPHIRHQESSRTLMSDVILLLLVLCALEFLYYGPRALMVCAAAVIPAVIADAACTLLRGRAPNPRDLSPIVTGLIIAMMMPASVPYYVPAAASVFAIAIVKHPFGGTGHNLFNPAAAGFSFAAICWPGLVFMYPMPFDRLPLFGDVTTTLYQNPAFVSRTDGRDQYSGRGRVPWISSVPAHCALAAPGPVFGHLRADRVFIPARRGRWDTVRHL